MELKEFNEKIGHILGLKGEVTYASVFKDIATDKVKIQLIITPTKAGREKIMSLFGNNKSG